MDYLFTGTLVAMTAIGIAVCSAVLISLVVSISKERWFRKTVKLIILILFAGFATIIKLLITVLRLLKKSVNKVGKWSIN